MAFFLRFFKQHKTAIIIPFWTGLLVLPFAGPRTSISLLTATAALFFVWKFAVNRWTIPAVLRRGGGVPERIRRVSVMSSRLVPGTRSPWTIAVVILALIVLPLFLNNYFRDVMTLTGMYIVLALGLNIIVGQAGLLNLGYVAFYAMGAYTYAVLSTAYGLSFWPGLAAGAFSAAAFAALIGLPILRLRGDYFAIVTLGLGEITRIVLNNWDSMTGGPNGISNVGRPVIGGYTLHTTLDFYYLILLMAVLTIFAMHRLIASRIGRAWIAIREDDVAAEAMGINTLRLKLLAFVLGSAVAGSTGVFFAAKMAFVSPESFTFFESVMILCMVVLGGMGSIGGIVLGALLLIALPEVFRDFQDYRMLAFGAALVLMMIFRPQGLLGGPKKRPAANEAGMQRPMEPQKLRKKPG